MDQLSELMAGAAAASWLTKVVVDLVRTRIKSLDGWGVLLFAFITGQAFSFAWALYNGETLSGLDSYAKVFIQGGLAFVGAVVATEAQTAAKKASNGEDI